MNDLCFFCLLSVNEHSLFCWVNLHLNSLLEFFHDFLFDLLHLLCFLSDKKFLRVLCFWLGKILESSDFILMISPRNLIFILKFVWGPNCSIINRVKYVSIFISCVWIWSCSINSFLCKRNYVEARKIKFLSLITINYLWPIVLY